MSTTSTSLAPCVLASRRALAPGLSRVPLCPGAYALRLAEDVSFVSAYRICAALLVVGLASSLLADEPRSAPPAKFNKVVRIGKAAPSFEKLPGIDGRNHSLAEYREAKILVVVFTCNRCPVAKAYEPRFRDFHAKFKARGVECVAINVGEGVDEELGKMQTRAREQNLGFPYLKDASQATARSYGATVTPHLFVLDAERRIAYMGAFDDNLSAAEVEKHFATEAVESLLAGKQPTPRETLQRGCAIPYN
ncbi:MAG: thioredoxin family protein [Planctomycetales bacterium]|nr:thioredoxin family protein [Planctomycetales bacterium]